MPKLYEYLGIKVSFFAGDHLPIHVHGRNEGKETKAEIMIENGEITTRYVTVKNRAPLTPQKQKDFETLVEHEAENIVRIWNEFKKTGIPPAPQRITRRIR
ncbi:MAG TPA: DUF4160 domain-containing protein [Candidatus Kapabacteria bacterium]|nr:DUF4160 domain-containing protein [Candidatus Kapabacteria bacterium]